MIILSCLFYLYLICCCWSLFILSNNFDTFEFIDEIFMNNYGKSVDKVGTNIYIVSILD